ncbi:lysine methyltransferase 5Ab [Salarias fasciatus]|uniref:lysine methyltransferase 5Ab n=1 Tax=Salarias fasciatus TaxID=181472 RepID=UPI001176FFA3|nr:N-lysine methyltransferase KMT5A-like [Salarias fasciatus]
MAKGKKHVLRADKNSADAAAPKPVSSKRETKENKPATNKESTGRVQTILQSFRTPCKQRSPLRDSSSVRIQEGNDIDAAHLDTLKLKEDLPSESREQLAEAACHSDSIRELTTVQQDSVTDKVPVRSKAERRPRARMENTQSRKVTDYFPVRRSNRKTQAKLKNEEQSHIDDLIKNNVEEGMQVKHIEGKGRGVFAVSGFRKGDFVVEYHGDLLDLTEAKKREAEYAQDPQTGCYMYYFQYQSKTYCVDATKETSRLGRLINHSKSGNCQTRLHPIDGTPHLILVASRDIRAEEELLYDYGDRSKSSISAHPWLKH